jgi:rRNA maturation RNase YbeY
MTTATFTGAGSGSHEGDDPGSPTPSAEDGPDPDPPQTAGPAERFRLIDRSGGRVGLDLDWLERRLGEAARHLPRPVGSVSLVVVADREMAAIHERYRGDPATTDVLTFDLADGGAGAIDAEIVICADEAARRAGELGHRVERELLATPDAHRSMHAEEDRILQSIGVGRTFDVERDAGSRSRLATESNA